MVENAINFLIYAMSEFTKWLMRTVIIQTDQYTITIGQTFIYFTIVYLVIAFLLGANISLTYKYKEQKHYENRENREIGKTRTFTRTSTNHNGEVTSSTSSITRNS